MYFHKRVFKTKSHVQIIYFLQKKTFPELWQDFEVLWGHELNNRKENAKTKEEYN